MRQIKSACFVVCSLILRIRCCLLNKNLLPSAVPGTIETINALKRLYLCAEEHRLCPCLCFDSSRSGISATIDSPRTPIVRRVGGVTGWLGRAGGVFWRATPQADPKRENSRRRHRPLCLTAPTPAALFSLLHF